jgi:RNA recognition motif-containing protein
LILAEEALIKLNYAKVAKKTIRISWYNREPNNFRAHPEYNIFIKKLNKTVTGKEFHDFFSKFGNIISAKLVEDDEGEVVGYGFVLYDNEDSANAAIKEGNGSLWKGKPIYVGRFEKNRPKKAPKFNTVYVKNLPKNYNQEDVRRLFSSYGDILSVFMKSTDPNLVEKLPDEKKKSILEHQFAFITFKDFNSASRVVNEFPYLKLNDNDYNTEIKNLVRVIESSGFFDNR